MKSKSGTRTSMSRVAREVRTAIKPLPMNGSGEAMATFAFDDGFIGFQGHFPAGPILPGVCQIECVLALLSEWKRARAKLIEITSAKYVLPALPGDLITCKISNLKETGEGMVSLRASLMKGEERVSDFRLKARLAPSAR